MKKCAIDLVPETRQVVHRGNEVILRAHFGQIPSVVRLFQAIHHGTSLQRHPSAILSDRRMGFDALDGHR